jgi:hypothetical protein
MRKTLALGASLATLLMAAGAMAASQYQISSVELDGGDTITLSGGVLGSSENVLAGAYIISGTDQNGNSFTTVAFCDDLFRTLATALGYSVTPVTPYAYTPEVLTTAPLASGGTTLSTGQVTEISGLVEEGLAIAENSPAGFQDALPAIQGAIWHVEYGVDATFSDSAETTDYETYIAQSFTSGPALALTAGTDGVTSNDLQGLVTVPEPAAWSLMLIGFGALGASVRRRRARLTA